jgi:hypothetical protein
VEEEAAFICHHQQMTNCLFVFYLIQYLLVHQLSISVSSSAIKFGVTTDWKQPSSNLASFSLPIFPLRKSVKYPTDDVPLTLYEERYLSLADHVLYGKNRGASPVVPSMVFGAWHCSAKSQIVRNNTITPLIEVGDVGVLCHVVYHKDEMISTLDSSECKLLRRRVTIVGVAVHRFRVEKIIFNGFDGTDVCPYIVVLAARICDITYSHLDYYTRLEWLEKKLWDEWNERNSINDKGASALKQYPSTKALGSFENVRARAQQVLSFFDSNDQDSFSNFRFNVSTSNDERNDLPYSNPENWHEYLSFAIISALATPAYNTDGLCNISLEKAEDFLKLSCSLERYEKIDEMLHNRPRSGTMLPFSVAVLLVINQLFFSQF